MLLLQISQTQIAFSGVYDLFLMTSGLAANMPQGFEGLARSTPAVLYPLVGDLKLGCSIRDEYC